MIRVFKAELFRISKLKSLKVLMILGIVFAILSNVALFFDQQGGFSKLNSVYLEKPLVEGNTEVHLYSRIDQEFNLTLPKVDSIKVNLKEGSNVIKLEKPLVAGDHAWINNGFMNISLRKVYKKDESTVRFRGTFIPDELGFTNEFTKYHGQEWLGLIVLVMSILVISSDYTNKRLKNFIHFFENRIHIVIGKFIALLTATVVVELVLCIICSLISLMFFGVGSSLNSKMFVGFMFKWIDVLLQSAFIISFVQFFSTLFKGGTAFVVAIYYLKGILLVPYYLLLGNLTSNWETGILKTLKEAMNHFLMYGVRNNALSTIIKGLEEMNYRPFFIAGTYTLIYIVFFLTATIFLFRKQEI